ncbi:MAG TPA: SIR2 family protein [Ignavibacteria bacterium]
MELPGHLKNQLIDGKLVLFLGSGASKESKDSNGKKPPTGSELRGLISNRFLKGKFLTKNLMEISDLAISESDLFTFQGFLKEIFDRFKPTEIFKGITTFKWVGIATTNYDRLIENAYEESPERLQNPIPFIDDTDRVDTSMHNEINIKLLKLHGCISRITNENCPLIISSEQFINYENERRNVFRQFYSWASDSEILFVGYSLNDPNFRSILKQIDFENKSRPKYFAVIPSFEDEEQRFWEQKRVTLIKGTFKDLFESAKEILPDNQRELLKIEKKEFQHPIGEKFIKNDSSISPSCLEFLKYDVDYVKSVISTKTIRAKDFYRGYNEEWSAIEQNLDVRRDLSDEILLSHFLIEEEEYNNKPEFIIVQAHAGAGKSILLRRIAWDAAKDYAKLCLYIKTGGSIKTDFIKELIILSGERLFLFVDNISRRIKEIRHLFKNIGSEGSKLTVIGCERINELNISCEELFPFITSKIDLKYLNLKEIDNLIELLRKHNALGTNLTGKTNDECRKEFAERMGRQLLVALHEATLGKKYEDIIVDEYNNITPNKAKSMYLTICILNRFDVPVRAGIISRLHGIKFEEFEKEFFKPLEQVIFTNDNKYIQEYEYKARHPYIAQIVFDNVLRDQNEKFDNYLSCLQALNTSYSSDEKAFRQMIKGNELKNLFSDSNKVKFIFKEAQNILGEDSSLYHQMAIYEMNRAGGNLKECLKFLTKASDLSPDNDIIRHTLAEYNLKMSDKVDTPLEKEKYRNEAFNLANKLKNSYTKTYYAYHTLVKIGLKKLEDFKIKNFDISNKEIEDTIKDIQKNLMDGLQQYPQNSYLLSAEADLAKYIYDSDKVIKCLENAFHANPTNTYVASRLAKKYVKDGNLIEAKKVMEKAIESNRNENKHHYFYSKILIELQESDNELILYHLKRAFTPGDNNYDAQILYARQLYIMGKDYHEMKSLFNNLEKARLAYEDKIKKLYLLKDEFIGQVNRIGSNYCIIQRDGIGDTILAKAEDFEDNVFNQITFNSRVHFKIAFNFKGPIAFEIKIINY